ncbi:protein ANTAGONIST OF LIKE HETEROCHROMATIN PROTEIN 1-like [Thrips palmi]|uniref:Protein ANTAGONIST OF LIKE HETEROCHROMATIN PROTEIN 1-like n=1 Tax=Thrips palmi TaxID=161013 RepID=A0A6P8Y067_THRPL|nr:protein ANTAGONIST OF LIKE HETEROCHROMATIN PROTEIN 1-like [Thrips palmi]
MEQEEPWIDARALEASWVYVTVNINEYHMMNDSVFKMHFRMSRRIFELLVQTVGNHLHDQGRLQRQRTDLQDILLMVVWVLATPDSFRSIALRFGRRPSTLWYFYSYVIMALRELAPRFIAWPSAEEKTVIKGVFQRATGFPGVVGSIDCTHIYISARNEDAAHYVNRHDTYSMNVQAVVDHTLLVRHLHVGEVGSMHDRRVLRRSPLLHDLLKEGEDRIVDRDEHILGDGGYQLTDFMLVPFANDNRLTEQLLLFNRRLSQCRVRVENAFGRATGKWRRLKYLHARNPEFGSRVEAGTASCSDKLQHPPLQLSNVPEKFAGQLPDFDPVPHPAVSCSPPLTEKLAETQIQPLYEHPKVLISHDENPPLTEKRAETQIQPLYEHPKVLILHDENPNQGFREVSFSVNSHLPVSSKWIKVAWLKTWSCQNLMCCRLILKISVLLVPWIS